MAGCSAFNNDVEYDLRESSVIGYKGARIEVVEATNEHIKYKVIQNFSRAPYEKRMDARASQHPCLRISPHE